MLEIKICLNGKKVEKADVKKTIKKGTKKIEKGAKALCEKVVPAPVKNFIKDASEDIDAICERDPAVKSRAEAALLYSGFHAIMAYRIANKLYRTEHFTSARFVSQSARFLTGIEIHPGATIGKGLFIDHGSGVVIGETAIIGDNCTLYQGVTLGGTGKDTGKRHPTLGDNVMVGAGAKVLGNFTVGSGAKIAAGAVVLGPVPENCTAVGIPAHVVRKEGKKLDKIDLDQVHIPDPVSQEICNMNRRMLAMEKKLAELEGGEKELRNE
ncbi:MAG: serine O-acetyltransferase [Clostridia bacterium]|nr:serine O-acetyltransferase [Clostridia bacterium]